MWKRTRERILVEAGSVAALRTLMSGPRSRSIVLTSAAGLAQRAAHVLIALVTVPLVLGHLGISGFGVWGAATSLAWISGMLDLGIASALVTLIPQSTTSGEIDRARDHVTAALTGGTCITVALLAIGVAVLALIPGGPDRTPFLIAGAALAINIPLSISGRIWLGLQKGFVASFWELFQSVLLLLLLLLAKTLGLGVAWFVAAVYAAILLTNAGCMLHVLIRHPWLAPRGLPSAIAIRQVFTSGGLMFLITVAAMCGYVFDNTLTLAVLGASASAQMTIAMRICAMGSGTLIVVSQAFWPAFAEGAADVDTAWMRRTLRNGLAITATLSLLGSAIIVAYGGPILRWWIAQDLHIDQTMLWAIAGWITFMALPQVPGFAVLAISRLRPFLLVTAVGSACSLLLKFAIARTWGVTGILVASPVFALTVVLPGTLWIFWSWAIGKRARARSDNGS